MQSSQSDFVLEKGIFNSIFEKDIRRVFIYKKVERLAKALQLIRPAFSKEVSLMDRLVAISVRLIDAAVLPPSEARLTLSRELLALSSLLSIARAGGLLSAMNAELITREARSLLEEVAWYEEPRLSLEEMPTLAVLAKRLPPREAAHPSFAREERELKKGNKRQEKDVSHVKDIKDRREAVLSLIRVKRKVSIKDISVVIRGVSEKTIQRELSALIADGLVFKQGERRWSTYSLS